MGVKVKIHRTHRRFTDGLEEVEVEGKTVGDCLEHLVKQYPGIREGLFDKKGKLLEDKFFYVMKVENPKGKLIVDFEGGKNIWVLKNKVKKMPKLFGDVLDILELIEKRGVQFIEKRFKVTGY